MTAHAGPQDFNRKPPHAASANQHGRRQDQPRLASPFGSHVLLPEHYVWLVFVSSLDVIFTTIVLFFGGEEVNPVADYLLQRWDIFGLIGLKFISISVVIIICEIIARMRYRTARRFATCAVIISAVPVVAAVVQLVAYSWGVW